MSCSAGNGERMISRLRTPVGGCAREELRAPAWISMAVTCLCSPGEHRLLPRWITQAGEKVTHFSGLARGDPRLKQHRHRRFHQVLIAGSSPQLGRIRHEHSGPVLLELPLLSQQASRPDTEATRI